MIKSLLICDSQGYFFYSRVFDEEFKDLDPTIFSGLISAIGTIGKRLFHEEIATISFGDNNKNSIVVVSKELFGDNKSIYFVFLIEGDPDLRMKRQLSTNIFIETKSILKNPNHANIDIQQKVDKILKLGYDM